jgi:catechol 2,3-dioxygenase-like lactoylglutathione lyase family enzyme
MRRFHVHVAVNDLDRSIGFYSKLFGQGPVVERQDYAKWMLEDPRLSFAISSRGHAAGVNHFGFQVDSADELASLKGWAEAASGGKVLDQGEAACCYAKGEKHWTIDPEGLAWEHFHTLSEAEEFGDDRAHQGAACCIPVKASAQDDARAEGACCIPNSETSALGGCCG